MEDIKIGDRVRNCAKSSERYGRQGVVYVASEEGFSSGSEIKNIKLRYDNGDEGVGNFEDYEIAPVNFILQYELEVDPFEMFENMADVERRIKELAKNPDLKREQICVYEVKSVLAVRLDTRVIFGNSVKVYTKAPVVKKGKPRGRKSKYKTLAEKKAAKREYMREWNAKRREQGNPVRINKIAD